MAECHFSLMNVKLYLRILVVIIAVATCTCFWNFFYITLAYILMPVNAIQVKYLYLYTSLSENLVGAAVQQMTMGIVHL